LQDLLLGIHSLFLVTSTAHEIVGLTSLGSEVHRRSVCLVVCCVDQYWVSLVLDLCRNLLILIRKAPQRWS